MGLSNQGGRVRAINRSLAWGPRLIIASLMVGICVPAFGEAATGITIWKPGVDVYQVDDDDSYKATFNTDGSLRIGNGVPGETSPVYRFSAPKLGTLTGITVVATGWEDNNTIGQSGTEVQVRTVADNWTTIGYFGYGSSFTATTTDTALWLSGDIDAGVVDLLDFRFVNSGLDDLRLDSVEVTLAYEDVSPFHLETFQMLYSLYQDVDDYGYNYGNWINASDFATRISEQALLDTFVETLRQGASALIGAGAYDLLGGAVPQYLVKAVAMAEFSHEQVDAVGGLLGLANWFGEQVALLAFPS